MAHLPSNTTGGDTAFAAPPNDLSSRHPFFRKIHYRLSQPKMAESPQTLTAEYPALGATPTPTDLPLSRQSIPAEVLGNVMEHLDIVHLRRCRLVNKTMCSEATRVLFRTLHVKATSKSRLGALEIVTTPSLAQHIRAVDYVPPAEHIFSLKGWDTLLFEPTLKRLTTTLQSHNVPPPSSIKLVAGSGDLRYLLSSNQALRIFLSQTKTFVFIPSGTTTLTMDELWQSDRIARFQSFSQGLQLLEHLSVDLSELKFVTTAPTHGMPLTSSILKWTFPKLRSLNLDSLVINANDDELVTFLERHQDTLKDVILGRPAFYIIRHQDLSLVCLALLLRFFLLLHEKTKLDRFSLEGTVYLYQDYGWKTQLELMVYCHEKGKIIGGRDQHYVQLSRPTSGNIRHDIEEYICHRHGFPFFQGHKHRAFIIQEIVGKRATDFEVNKPCLRVEKPFKGGLSYGAWLMLKDSTLLLPKVEADLTFDILYPRREISEID